MDKQTYMAKPSLSVCSADLGELTIIIRPFDSSYCEYVGTRKQLESEGVIPAETEWPHGFWDVVWEANAISFWLRRQRPKGVKGPRRDFLDCDNWCLRMRSGNYRCGHDAVIERKAKELARVVYEHSPEGRAAFMRRVDLSLAADSDEKFQAFKALIPGLIPPPRKRRETKIAVQSQEANHG